MSAGCCEPAPPLGQIDPKARRVLIWALIINAAMFAIELSAGLYGQSVSLQADAVDFFGDALSYGVSLAALGMAVTVRTRVAALKGIVMGLFGFWVLGLSAYHLYAGTLPSAPIMGSVGALALVANLVCALLLFRFRGADANMKSVWICSRNDAISNIAVIIAASGVWAASSGLPDLIVAAAMGVLALYGSAEVLRAAHGEHRAHGAEASEEPAE